MCYVHQGKEEPTAEQAAAAAAKEAARILREQEKVQYYLLYSIRLLCCSIVFVPSHYISTVHITNHLEMRHYDIYGCVCTWCMVCSDYMMYMT